LRAAGGLLWGLERWQDTVLSEVSKNGLVGPKPAESAKSHQKSDRKDICCISSSQVASETPKELWQKR